MVCVRVQCGQFILPPSWERVFASANHFSGVLHVGLDSHSATYLLAVCLGQSLTLPGPYHPGLLGAAHLCLVARCLHVISTELTALSVRTTLIAADKKGGCQTTHRETKPTNECGHTSTRPEAWGSTALPRRWEWLSF